jgi:predicted PurR-regulated permease PerM
MSSSLKQRNPLSIEDSSHVSLRRRLTVSLTALVWLVLAGITIWVIGHVVEAVVLLSIAALVASLQQVIAQLRDIVSDIVPLLHSMFTLFLNMVLITTLSIYLLFEGERISNWLRHRTPLSQRERIAFLMTTVDRAVGGSIRGTFVINALTGLLIGVGASVSSRA